MALDGTLRPPISPIQPGAYSAIDASALQGAGLAGLPIVCIIGAALGGTPNQPYTFLDPYQAKNRLRGQALVDMVRFAFGAGAGVVKAVRAGSTITQSTLALAGATATPVTLTSLDYGSWTTQIKATVAANNSVTISYVDAANGGITYSEVFALGATATAQNVVDAINGKLAGYQASQYVSAAVTTGTMPLTVIASTALAGGADGSSNALIGSDWTAALQAIEGEDVDIVVPATGDSTIHAQVLTHCQNMSTSAARRERVADLGGVLGESVTTVIARMATLHDKRVQVVYPGVVDFDANGLLKQWDPFYAAAKIAGMHAALPDPATSLTHDLVPTVDLEQQSGKYLSTLQGSDLDQLLRAGITPIAPAGQSTGGFWVVDSLTGWNQDDSFRDFHKTRAADAVAVRLRTVLEAKFVGGKALDSSDNDITVAANGVLDNLQLEGIVRAHRDAQVTQGADARTWIVTAPVLLPDAIKYILITVALQPSSSVNKLQPASPSGLL